MTDRKGEVCKSVPRHLPMILCGGRLCAWKPANLALLQTKRTDDAELRLRLNPRFNERFWPLQVEMRCGVHFILISKQCFIRWVSEHSPPVVITFQFSVFILNVFLILLKEMIFLSLKDFFEISYLAVTKAPV